MIDGRTWTDERWSKQMKTLRTKQRATKMAGSMGRKRKEPDANKYTGRIAARLLKLRVESGKTAQEMAQALGVPYSTYATYENGSAEWPNELTPDFARIVGIGPRTVYPSE